MGNGGLIGNIPNPTYNSAKGVWYLNSQFPLYRVQSVFLAESATSTTASITIPAASQEGDIAVLFDTAIQSSTTQPTTVVPSGFNTIVNTGFSGNFACRGIFSYKILTASDPGTSITGLDGTFAERKIMAVFRIVGNWKTPQITLSTPSTELTDGNPVAQTIAMTATTPVLIGFVGYGNGSAQIDPRTATGASFTELSAAISCYMKFCIFNEGDTPTDATVDMDDEGSNNILQSFWMRIS